MSAHPDGKQFSLDIHPVSSFDQLLQSFRLVHDQYVRSGFIEPNRDGMRFSLRDLFPCSMTFVACKDYKVVGTISAVKLWILGLPSQNAFGDWYQLLTLSNRKVGEGTKFACVESFDGGMVLAKEMVKWLVQWSVVNAMDDLVVVVNPRHRFFWQGRLGFEFLCDERTCSHVAGNPGILLRLDVSQAWERRVKESVVIRKMLDSIELSEAKFYSSYRLTDENVVELIQHSPKVFTDADSIERELLQEYFPLAYREISRIRETAVSASSAPCSSRSSSASADLVLGPPHDSCLLESGPRSVFPVRCMALRWSIQKIIDAIRREEGLSPRQLLCQVADSVPDNLLAAVETMEQVLKVGVVYAENLQARKDLGILIRVSSVSQQVGGASSSGINLKIAFSLWSGGVSEADRVQIDRNIESFGRLREIITSSLAPRCTRIHFDEQSGAIFEVELAAHVLFNSKLLPSHNRRGEGVEHSERGSGGRAAVRGDQVTVLVIEDNLVNQLVARRILEKAGYQVLVADSGRAGLELLDIHWVDLVLLDCQMPGMSGFEVVKCMRESRSERQRGVPVVAVTAFAMDGDRERCLACGFDAYLAKPYTVAGLLETVIAHLPERELSSHDNNPRAAGSA